MGELIDLGTGEHVVEKDSVVEEKSLMASYSPQPEETKLAKDTAPGAVRTLKKTLTPKVSLSWGSACDRSFLILISNFKN